MRLSLTIVGLLACLITLVAAWSKEDQEIFRLRDEVELSEGSGVTFYDFLEIIPSASQDEINKAYRKKSRILHPDKVNRLFSDDKKQSGGKKGSKIPSKSEIKSAGKAASDRFARLGIVAEILRGPGRERYDHFLRNGFPTWRGSGYYYARFRPGLGSVFVFLFVFVGGGAHWVMLFTSWKQQQKFVQKYITDARRIAWKDGMGIPIPGLDTAATAPAADENEAQQQQQIPRNRRERRIADKMEAKDMKKEKKQPKKAAKSSPTVSPTPPSGIVGPRKKVVAENGKMLIVDSAGNVYLEQRDEDGEVHEYLLDVNEIPRPTIKSTALYRLPAWTINTLISRFTSESSENTDDGDSDGNVDEKDAEVREGEETESASDDFEVIKKEKAKTSAVNGKAGAGKRGKKKKL